MCTHVPPTMSRTLLLLALPALALAAAGVGLSRTASHTTAGGGPLEVVAAENV